ncbi:MAG: hypothetical protein HC769_07450 [Cyanobacteria bacterium CRU_2_1]|nr:hypothetical protein [Cyanobacteria bacterium CRU_2_1]
MQWDKDGNCDRLQIITSELTILETLVVPLRTQNTVLINAYEQLLSGTVLTP